MKGHLEIFEHRLKYMASRLPGADALDLDQEFLRFEQALGTTIPFYDVKNGSTLADYYASAFTQFIKTAVKSQPKQS